MFQQRFPGSVELQATEIELEELVTNSIKCPRKICNHHASIKKPHIWIKYGVHSFTIIKVAHTFIYCLLDPHIFLYRSIKITWTWQSRMIIVALHTFFADLKVFLQLSLEK
jgi:hypothetical protein